MAKKKKRKNVYKCIVSNECFLTTLEKSILSNPLLNESRTILAYFSHSHRNAPRFLEPNEIEMVTIYASTYLKENKVSLNFILRKWTSVQSEYRHSTSRHF